MENKYISSRVDIKHIIGMLKRAIALEIQAAYFYFITGSNVYGYEAKSISKEFAELAKDELEHAKLLRDRLKELCSEVELKMKDGDFIIEIDQYCSDNVIQLNIKAEEEAMNLYYELIQYTENRDHVTCKLATHLMKEESKHNSILNDFRKDINHIKSK